MGEQVTIPTFRSEKYCWLRQQATLDLMDIDEAVMQMGVLILFIYDDSPHQQRTRKLVDGALDLTVRFLSLAKNPLLKPLRSKVLSLLREAELVPDFELTKFQPEKSKLDA